MSKTKFVGVTLPIPIYEYIITEIENGAYSSPADWIRSACRDYYEKRLKERRGGGASLGIDRRASAVRRPRRQYPAILYYSFTGAINGFFNCDFWDFRN